MEKTNILGIDLGTTYCAASYINENNQIVIVPNGYGHLTTPSVVFVENQSFVIGEKAKQSILVGGSSFSNIKSKIGTNFQFKNRSGSYSSEELSAILLKQLKKDAEVYSGHPFPYCVITVPAYFQDAQRVATENAGTIAGFKVIGILNEPTSAALAYMQQTAISNGKVLVYDLGGGTFDVTLLDISGRNHAKVVATVGKQDLGGFLFDRKIIKYLCSQLKERYGIDTEDTAYLWLLRKIMIEAESYKCQLTSKESVTFSCSTDKGSVKIELTREWFEKAISDDVDRTLAEVKSLLCNAGAAFSDIDILLAVGGSCKIPYVVSRLETLFGKKCDIRCDKDLAVAYGASVYSEILSGQSDCQMVDVCSHGIGVTSIDVQNKKGYNKILIPQNTPIPATCKHAFYLASDSQQYIHLEVNEGDSEQLKSVTCISEFNIVLPQPMPKGTLVNIRLQLDRNQILHVGIEIDAICFLEELKVDRKIDMSSQNLEKASEMVGALTSMLEPPKPIVKENNESRKLPSSAPAPTGKKQDVKDDFTRWLEQQFHDLVGMKEIQETLLGFYTQLLYNCDREKALGISVGTGALNFQLLGNPGTGKSTVARIIQKILYRMHLRTSNAFVECDRGKIVGHYIGETEKNMTDLIEKAKGGVLFVDEAYSLYQEDSERDFGREALVVLLKAMEDMRDTTTFILAGYKEEMRGLMKANPGFESRIQYTIEIPDYTSEELVEISGRIAHQKSYVLDESGKKAIRILSERERVDRNFANARFIRTTVEKAISRQGKRLFNQHPSKADMITLKAEDFGIDLEESPEQAIKEELDELNRLIGLSSVKQQVKDMLNSVKLRQMYRKNDVEFGESQPSLHMVFYGNPGTGKTTVARLIGRIYGSLGLIKRPDVFVECSRKDLIGTHCGWTEKQTKELIQRAMGGILFIDEAYSLISDEQDSFGREAVDVLMTEMENNRGNLVVVLAGYQDRMEQFLGTNPGFRSRISTYIQFKDYTPEEMVQIFCLYAEKDKRPMGPGARKAAAQLLEQKAHRSDFGNARGVRNVYQLVLKNQNRRITKQTAGKTPSREELIALLSIEASDFEEI